MHCVSHWPVKNKWRYCLEPTKMPVWCTIPQSHFVAHVGPVVLFTRITPSCPVPTRQPLAVCSRTSPLCRRTIFHEVDRLQTGFVVTKLQKYWINHLVVTCHFAVISQFQNTHGRRSGWREVRSNQTESDRPSGYGRACETHEKRLRTVKTVLRYICYAGFLCTVVIQTGRNPNLKTMCSVYRVPMFSYCVASQNYKHFSERIQLQTVSIIKVPRP